MTSTTTSTLSTAQQHGLPAADITAIQQVLAAHPEVETAILYGSRAMGTHRPASDIDLMLTVSNLTTDGLARIDEDLDDLLLPYRMDLPCLTTITHPPL